MCKLEEYVPSMRRDYGLRIIVTMADKQDGKWWGISELTRSVNYFFSGLYECETLSEDTVYRYLIELSSGEEQMFLTFRISQKRVGRKYYFKYEATKVNEEYVQLRTFAKRCYTIAVYDLLCAKKDEPLTLEEISAGLQEVVKMKTLRKIVKDLVCLTEFYPSQMVIKEETRHLRKEYQTVFFAKERE